MPKRILVPLDQTVAAEAVVPLVAAIARDGGASVRLLRVSRMPENRVTDEGRVVAYADQEMSRLESEGVDYLRTVEMQLDGAGAVDCVVRFGDPVAEILDEAEEFGADLIAVTTAGRSALGRTALGSVAEQVVRKAEAPVILMRPARTAA